MATRWRRLVLYGIFNADFNLWWIFHNVENLIFLKSGKKIRDIPETINWSIVAKILLNAVYVLTERQ
jgi:hypothetical protein